MVLRPGPVLVRTVGAQGQGLTESLVRRDRGSGDLDQHPETPRRGAGGVLLIVAVPCTGVRPPQCCLLTGVKGAEVCVHS